MKPRFVLTLAAVAALCGCRAKEISSIDRAQAANEASEAEFAVTLKDWPRAEGLFAKAAELCPDDADYWVNLGIVRMRLHDSSGARKAYKNALPDYDAEFEKDPDNSSLVIRHAYTLVLLGRQDDARDLVDKAHAKYPLDLRLRAFVEGKGIDKMLSDPSLKDLSPQ